MGSLFGRVESSPSISHSISPSSSALSSEFHMPMPIWSDCPDSVAERDRARVCTLRCLPILSSMANFLAMASGVGCDDMPGDERDCCRYDVLGGVCDLDERALGLCDRSDEVGDTTTAGHAQGNEESDKEGQLLLMGDKEEGGVFWWGICTWG